MSEELQKETTGTQPTQASTGAGSGNEHSTGDIIDRTNKALELSKQENDRMEKNIARLEKLYSEFKLGGASLGGAAEKSPEQKAEEEAQAFADRLTQRYFPVKKVRL